jgi:GntR family transcriptional regulator
VVAAADLGLGLDVVARHSLGERHAQDPLVAVEAAGGVSEEDDAMVDRELPIPAYQQVAAILRARIESGEYGIALTTAGKALHLLVTEGLAVMSPGMGMYVKRRR